MDGAEGVFEEGESDVRARMLLVDDDAFFHYLFKRIMSSYDLDVRYCFTLEEAQMVVGTEKFDYVLVDQNFGGGNGSDFLARLPKGEYEKFLISAMDRTTLANYMYESGATDVAVIHKPTMMRELEHWFGSHKKKVGE